VLTISFTSIYKKEYQIAPKKVNLKPFGGVLRPESLKAVNYRGFKLLSRLINSLPYFSGKIRQTIKKGKNEISQ